MHPTRRSVLTSLLAVPPAMLLKASGAFAQGAPSPLPLTPSCGAQDAPTPSQTAGPFYKPASPLKTNLKADVQGGEPITLAGFVVDTQCRPIRGALVEIWHADTAGAYDNAGFRLRGHQLADEAGRWGFTTLVTAQYPGRTAHYHFRVQRPNGQPLITQLYFPDHPGNARDGLFDPALVMKVSREANQRLGRFEFVV